MRNRMFGEVLSFVDDLAASLDSVIPFDRIDPSDVILCGMGGSAIGGDLVARTFSDRIGVPVTVNRTPALPNWVSENTLAVILSYSGNTSETLSMYRQALETGCRRICITSGGELVWKAGSVGDPVVLLPEGIQPRSSLGYVYGYLTSILGTALGTDFTQDVRDALPGLRRTATAMDGGQARRIAEAIGNKVPVIFSGQMLYPTAFRWKTQFNENSKSMAFSGSVPDLNHDSVVGWSSPDALESFHPIFIREEGADERALEKAIEELVGFGFEPTVVYATGHTLPERMLNAVIIGDQVSVHLADLRGADPLEVDRIKELKGMVAQRMGTVRS